MKKKKKKRRLSHRHDKMDRKTESPRGNGAFKESGGQAIHESHPLTCLVQGEENTCTSITLLGGEDGVEADGSGEGVCVCVFSRSVVK